MSDKLVASVYYRQHSLLIDKSFQQIRFTNWLAIARILLIICL